MAITKAHFRLILTECCGVLLCWVNPRHPNYCPECGKHIYPAVRSWVTFSDEQAYIRHKSDNPVRSEPPVGVSGGIRPADVEENE